MRFSVFYIAILWCGSTLFAQDLEPRRWTELPVGVQVVGAGYAFSFGDVEFDPILQVEDATVEVNTLIASYVLPIRIGKKLGRIDAMVPFKLAHWEGLLSDVPTSLNRSGFSDPRIRMSINIIGVSAEESKNLVEYFKEHPVRTTVGFSVAVTLPLGQYFDDKLINLGQNRFIIQPQAGLVHTWNKWSFEFTASTFIFTNNNNFFNDTKKEQHPVIAVQSHLIKRFKPGYWAAISAGYGNGGESIIDHQQINDARADLLGAISFGFPLSKGHGGKFAYIRSQTLKEIGSDVNTFTIGWSYLIN